LPLLPRSDATRAAAATGVNAALRLPHKLHVQTNPIFECFRYGRPVNAQASGAQRARQSRMGTGDVVEIANSAAAHRASLSEAIASRSRLDPVHTDALVPLTAMATEQWRELAARAIEPNGYYLPDWQLAVNASAPGRTDGSALSAWSDAEPSARQLIGLLPAISLWRACKIPLPALASADPYGTLCTPLLDRDRAYDAVAGLMRQANESGARALILRDMSLGGAAMRTITHVLGASGLKPYVLKSHARACLDASRDADQLLRESLGPKKLKELRRQRSRLAEHGEVVFEVARTPAEVAGGLEIFLSLEASGWKGRRGTALNQNDGDASFIRRATLALAERGSCEIVTLRCGATAVAAAIVPRHQDRAFYFKLGIDERFAKFSPGVQLTLDLTRHLCADPAIRTADSTASAGHPMIDPIWRGRLAIGDVLIPLRRRDPVVSLIHAAVMLHRRGRETAGSIARFIRSRHEKRA
jgi:CelD/BcsL family acetyltransferase involved in cellulose biosynthesis